MSYFSDESISLSDVLLDDDLHIDNQTLPLYESNPIAFDADLPEELDDILVKLKKLHFLTVHAIDYDTAEQARAHFAEFRDEFREYLVNISVNLYVHLRHALRDEPERVEFISRFESKTRELIDEYSELLVKYSHPEEVLDDDFKGKFIEMGARFIRRSKQERAQLFALYRPVF